LLVFFADLGALFLWSCKLRCAISLVLQTQVRYVWQVVGLGALFFRLGCNPFLCMGIAFA
jgi:hypothetical protein